MDQDHAGVFTALPVAEGRPGVGPLRLLLLRDVQPVAKYARGAAGRVGGCKPWESRDVGCVLFPQVGDELLETPRPATSRSS